MFACRVVGAGADRAHRPDHPKLDAEAGEGPGAVLTGFNQSIHQSAFATLATEFGIRLSVGRTGQ
jgi:hypothetical protein